MMPPGKSHEEPPFDPEPEPYRPPVRCPTCDSDQVEFLRLEYERSVYHCKSCNIQFDLEEPG